MILTIERQVSLQAPFTYWPVIPLGIAVIVALVTIAKSLHSIGPTEVGLVNKRLGKKISEANVIAMDGEAGYQADLLMPGLRFKFWPIYAVNKYPWVQVPAGEIGVVVAQVGKPLPSGAKSAVYKDEFGDFRDLRTFLENDGQKGLQRPVLPPGSLAPIHPVAFLVVTSKQVFGEAVSPEISAGRFGDSLSPETFGLRSDQLHVVNITAPSQGGDVMGVVTVLEGQPLDKGDIASRLGGYSDITALEASGEGDNEIIAALLGSKNDEHNNYQDFQAFLDHGGRIGLQHDPLLYGAYLLNPLLVNVQIVPMSVVEQGEVAVIKSYVGLPAQDTSGDTFKFGSIVKPGHQGIWSEVLRTGKYAINHRCYSAVIVPTSILTLNWAEATSEAHDLDKGLSAIDAKSREGFVFKIDLQVQIHVPDTKASRVISTVGTMENLVNEVLQSAVGNYFRNALQQLEAVKFIQTRSEVQKDAEAYVKEYLEGYDVEVKGVYIQDVVLPEDLVKVLKDRELAVQNTTTYEQERLAQNARVELEKAKGTADAQMELAKSQVSIEMQQNNAKAKEAEAQGAAAFTKATGEAEAAVIKAKGTAKAEITEALGLARAKGYEAQVAAVGQQATASVAVMEQISGGNVKITPDVLVTGGSSFDGLAASLIPQLGNLTNRPGTPSGTTDDATDGLDTPDKDKPKGKVLV